MKSLYVRTLHRARTVLAALGLLRLLDRAARHSRTALWVRSWFAVYDLDDLAALDTPWWTFEAADRVEAFLAARPDARVFEWGSGASTLWLARRCASVTSVEHDASWAEQMSILLPDNVDLVLAEPVPRSALARRRSGGGSGGGSGGRMVAQPAYVGSRKPGFEGLDFADYVAAIDDAPGGVEGRLDLIIIDGRAREACLARAVDRLAPGGMIVLDNVDRQRYRDAIDLHVGSRPELGVRWTRGRTPALPYPTRTALIGRGTVA